MQVVQIPGAGAFIYNARGRLASVTVRVGSRAWALRDKGTQEAAYDGFVEWLSSLENLPGVRETTIRIRVDRASSNELRDYLVAREGEFDPQVSDELRRAVLGADPGGVEAVDGVHELHHPHLRHRRPQQLPSATPAKA